MAYREIVIPTEDTAASANYAKFDAIGDEHTGLYVSKKDRPAHDNFKASVEYTFKNKAGSFSITPPFKLREGLAIAEAETDPSKKLIPGVSICKMIFVSTVPPKKEGYSAMKTFKLLIDNDFMQSKQAAKPAPAPVPDDDIPF